MVLLNTNLGHGRPQPEINMTKKKWKIKWSQLKGWYRAHGCAGMETEYRCLFTTDLFAKSQDYWPVRPATEGGLKAAIHLRRAMALPRPDKWA